MPSDGVAVNWGRVSFIPKTGGAVPQKYIRSIHSKQWILMNKQVKKLYDWVGIGQFLDLNTR